MSEFNKYQEKGDYHWRNYRRVQSLYHTHVNKVIAWVEDGDILDIGAGDGLITSKLNAIGVDDNIKAVELAQSHKVPVKIGSTYNLPFEDKSFDIVFMGDIIEHLEQPVLALKEAHRVLRDTGSLYITTPLKDGQVTDPYHYTEYTEEELKILVEKQGFILTTIEIMNKKIYAKFTICG